MAVTDAMRPGSHTLMTMRRPSVYVKDRCSLEVRRVMGLGEHQELSGELVRIWFLGLDIGYRAGFSL